MNKKNQEPIKKKDKERRLVYVVEDEPDILELIAINLSRAGYEVQKFLEASPMISALEKEIPDLMILDLMLPDHDGLDICKALKKDERFAEIPLIMVTAKTDELDVVLGLELGADDYIPKPFSPRELVARVKAVMRRFQRRKTQSPDGHRINISDILTIDTGKYEVMVKNEKVHLTSTEFMILKLLAEKPGWVYSREKILDYLWGDEKDVFDRTVDVHIKNLRDKLGSAASLVKNIRGVGYKIELS